LQWIQPSRPNAGYHEFDDFPLLTPFFSTVFAGVASAFVTTLNAATGRSSGLPCRRNAGAQIRDLTVDGAGNVYLAGSTVATDLGHGRGLPSDKGANGDGYIAKFRQWLRNPWCTYLGLQENDQPKTIAIDPRGISTSPERPTPPTPPGRSVRIPPSMEIQRLRLQDLQLRVRASLVVLLASGVENVFGIAVDATGSAAVTGPTLSPDFPTTPRRLGPHPGL